MFWIEVFLIGHCVPPKVIPVIQKYLEIKYFLSNGIISKPSESFNPLKAYLKYKQIITRQDKRYALRKLMEIIKNILTA